MASTVNDEILSLFQTHPTKDWEVSDIVKNARMPKKQLNAHLYKLQRQSMVEKVQESPPIWRLSKSMKSSPRTKHGDFPADQTFAETATGSRSPQRTTRLRSSSKGNTSSGAPDLQQRILEFLRRFDYPLTTLNIARGVGLSTASQVNQTLYLMQNRGFISKAKEKPVEWALVPHFLSSGSSSDENDVGGRMTGVFTSPETLPEFNNDETLQDSNVEFSSGFDMSGYEGNVLSNTEEPNDDMIVDPAKETYDVARTPENRLEEYPLRLALDSSPNKPELDGYSESTNVNDEALAQIKRLVEESMPAMDTEANRAESSHSSEMSDMKEKLKEDNGIGSYDIEEVNAEPSHESHLSGGGEISESRDVPYETVRMESSRSSGSPEKLDIENNAVLKAMSGPKPEIKREKEFTVPDVEGMIPFKALTDNVKPVPLGRGRAMNETSVMETFPLSKPGEQLPNRGPVTKSSMPSSRSTNPGSSSFSRPLPPHELLRMRGELPPAAEKAFSQHTPLMNAIPMFGRGRGITSNQLKIPGEQSTRFSSTGNVMADSNPWGSSAGPPTPSPWTNKALPGNGNKEKKSIPVPPVPMKVTPEPKGKHDFTGGYPSGPGQNTNASNATKPMSASSGKKKSGKAKKSVEPDPFAALRRSNVKPAPPPSSFKLPPSPLDLVKNTSTWGTGVTPKEPSPELEAQNALLIALNVPSEPSTSSSTFASNARDFGNNMQNVPNAQNFGNNSTQKFGDANFGINSQSFGNNSSQKFGNANFGNNSQSFGNNSSQKFGSTNFGNNSQNFGNNSSQKFGSVNFGSNSQSGFSSRPALGLASAPVTQTSNLPTKLTGLTKKDMENSTGPGGSFNNESFNMLNKNPISALTEYAQTRKLQVDIKIVGESGPAHKKRFQMAAIVGKERFPAVCGTNKKECRKDAADVALRALMADGKFHVAKSSDVPKIPIPTKATTHFDNVASLSHSVFNTLAARIAENLSGRKVLAALIMKRGPNDDGSVISMGTGNRCITGPQMSLEGHTVNDTHAEIVTRRGFIRFLYKQLETVPLGSSECIFQQSESGKLRIRDGITFHLYVSTAPCGDGALFSPRDADGSLVNEEDNKLDHTPTFVNAVQGILRTKIEGGEGTIPLEPGFVGQTWDGILRGERLRTMSCSDKLCRWNILGMQGALLSHFLDPIYMDTFTLGYLYDHGHLSRALCCRLQRGDPPIEDILPPYYKLNHPHLGRVTVYEAQRGTEKTKSVSLNWCAGDEGAEVLDGSLGSVLDKTRTNIISRIAKKSLFESFRGLCAKFNKQELLKAETYYAAKQGAEDFQKVKTIMIERFRKNRLGPWVQKPMEEKMFL